LMPSAVPHAEVPAPFTVNVPFEKLALPDRPTEPISKSSQPGGRFDTAAVVTVRLSIVVLVRLPDVPVMVTVAVPVVAVPVAVSVSVLVAVAGLGLKDAVTPLGRPEADKLTLLLKPFCGVTVIVLVLLAPCMKLRLVGDAERAKFGGGAIMVRLSVVACVKVPEVPVIVTETVPVVAVPVADNVSALVVVVLVGLKAAVTPLGSPEADRVTRLLKPLCGVTLIVVVPVVPCVTVRVPGEAERV
jgi:hypothetical protein